MSHTPVVYVTSKVLLRHRLDGDWSVFKRGDRIQKTTGQPIIFIAGLQMMEMKDINGDVKLWNAVSEDAKELLRNSVDAAVVVWSEKSGIHLLVSQPLVHLIR